ncbi:MAG: ThuA domain-containing protein, partial [Armatimonadota bacterium]|nr:ThuA domain-containing protein [Armatimonadota bacterium]
LGPPNGLEVTCTKDGRVFTPENIAQYDLFVFYTTGDLTQPGTDKQPPMAPEMKEALLSAIHEGKPFVGIHTATDTFHNSREVDPYIAMVGGEFYSHGRQQVARMRVASPRFPGCEGLGEGFDLNDEWYTFKNLANDLHVVLVQETQGMDGWQYSRPAFPATWARMHGKGRVFYTSMGHREDVWTNPVFQKVLLGGIDWALGRRDADVTPTVEQVTPGYRELPKAPASR